MVLPSIASLNISVMFCRTDTDRIARRHFFLPCNCNDVNADCNPTLSGQDYVGQVSATVNGRTCQAWSSQSPHTHTMTSDAMYSDGSVVAANNYCRNPDGSAVGLWCYTTDPSVLSETCNVPLCGELYYIQGGAEKMGPPSHCKYSEIP